MLPLSFYNLILILNHYTDSEEEWKLIYIGSNNDCLTNATTIYNYIPEE